MRWGIYVAKSTSNTDLLDVDSIHNTDLSIDYKATKDK